MPLVDTPVEVITLVVADIPLIVVVNVLPDTFCEKELIILATPEDTPFTMTSNKLALDDAIFEFMIDVVASLPLTIEVNKLFDEIN